MIVTLGEEERGKKSNASLEAKKKSEKKMKNWEIKTKIH